MAYWVVLAVAVCLVSCGRGKTASVEASSTPAAVEVRLGKPESRALAVSLTATGSLVARETAAVAAIAGGPVLRIAVAEGSAVERGGVLVEINAADYRLRLDQARAAEAQAQLALKQAENEVAARGGTAFDPLRQRAVVVAEANRSAALEEKQEASVNLNRYLELLKTGDVSEAAVDQARSRLAAANTQLAVTNAQYESALAVARTTPDQVGVALANLASARAAVGVAEANLEQCKVRSPIAGYVITRSVSPGAYLAPGSTVATIAQTNPIVMEALIPEGRETMLTAGMAASIHVPSFPGKPFPGTLRELSRALDVASRSVIARIDIPNPGGVLRPGMFATAEVSLPQTEWALFVPASAIHNPGGDGTLLVYVARGQRLEAAIVRTAAAERSSPPAGMVRVYSGLDPSLQVVIAASGRLADGAPYRVRQ